MYYEDYEAEYESFEIENRYENYCNNLLVSPISYHKSAIVDVTARARIIKQEVNQTESVKLKLNDVFITQEYGTSDRMNFIEEAKTRNESANFLEKNELNIVEVFDFSPNESKSKLSNPVAET